MEQLFSQLPGNAKVWVYQSSREFDVSETNTITGLINDFVVQWSSHSRKVTADGAVFYNRFVALTADESAFDVSGCSIDSSVNFIRQLEQKFNTNFFDRMTVAYLDGDLVKTADRETFQQLLDKGVVNENTIVFNNLVSDLNELRLNWKIPFTKSWHGRFFKAKAGTI